MECPRCGTEIIDEASGFLQCPACGNDLKTRSKKHSLPYIIVGTIMLVICAILAGVSINAWGPHFVTMITVAAIALIIATVLFLLAYQTRRK
jgi:uncharacterized protein (DUF983 family)